MFDANRLRSVESFSSDGIPQENYKLEGDSVPSSESGGSRKKFWIKTEQADIIFGIWIALNALALAVETEIRNGSNDSHLAWFICDSIFNVVFLVELLLRIYAERRQWAKDCWNLFDFSLVLIGVLDTWIMPLAGTTTNIRFVTLFRLLRLMRLFRLLRVLRFLKELMLLVSGIASAMRAMVWGMFLLAITIFMGSLLITKLVGKECCDADDTFQDPFYSDHFGSVVRTAFTLFQFTMEFQPDICRFTWPDGMGLTFFFIVYTLFTNLTLLNIIASVIVENILNIAQKRCEEEYVAQREEHEQQTRDKLKAIFREADKDCNGLLDWEELNPVQPGVAKALKVAGVPPNQARDLFQVLDCDGSGQISLEEFTQGLERVSKPPQAKHLLTLERRLVAMDTKMKVSLADSVQHQKEVLSVLKRVEERQQNLQAVFESENSWEMQLPMPVSLQEPEPAKLIQHSRKATIQDCRASI